MKAIISPIDRVENTLSIKRRNPSSLWTKFWFLIGVLVIPSYLINAGGVSAEEIEHSAPALRSTSRVEAPLPDELSKTEQDASVTVASPPTVLPLESEDVLAEEPSPPLPSPPLKSITTEVTQPPLNLRVKQFKIDASNLPVKQPRQQELQTNIMSNESTLRLGDRGPLSPLEASLRSKVPSSRVRLLIPNFRNLSAVTQTNRAFNTLPVPIRQPRRVPQSTPTIWTLRRSLASPQGKPAHGFVFISSLFGKRRNPFGRGVEFHNGVDLVGAKGIPILATARGRVMPRKRRRGYGISVILKHDYGYETLYAHLSKKLVKPNQIVERGDIVGYLGSTGRSTGPHLHYSVYLNRQAVDPKPYLFK